jgi:hypothetical protein
VTAAAPLAPSSGTGADATSAAPPPAGLGREALRAERGQVRRRARELGGDEGVATEDRRGDGDRTAVDGDVDVVREHRAVELHREASHHVTARVVLREEDEVGRVATVDDGLHRRGHGHARQLAAEVARRVHLGGAVLAEGAGDRRGVATHEGGDGAQRAGLGEQFEGARGGRAGRFLSEDPYVRHVSSFLFVRVSLLR